MRWLPALLLVIGLALPSHAHAQPRVGAPLPSFTSVDVGNRVHNSSELRGRPTLLVVVTGNEATPRTKVWLDQIKRHFPDDRIRVVTIVTLDLFGLPTLGMVRHGIRAKVAPQFWGNTWVDARGGMRRALGLEMRNQQPFIIALDRDGRITAEAHGAFAENAASAVWTALDAPR